MNNSLSCSVKLPISIYIVCTLSALIFWVTILSTFLLVLQLASAVGQNVKAQAAFHVTYPTLTNRCQMVFANLVNLGNSQLPVDQSTVHACSGRHSCHTEQEASNKQPSTSLNHRLSSKRSRQTNPCKIKTNWHRNMFIEEQVTNAHPHLSQPVVFFPNC